MTIQAPDGLVGGSAAGAGDAQPVLSLEQVSKTYPGAPPVHALRRVSLTIRPGELAAIVGPSGSGKSTLLHVMGTLDRPSSGTVRITGLDAARMTDHELAWLRATRIGFVFQQPFLAEHATVLDNVADGLLYAGVRLTQRRQRAAEALDRVGLGAQADGPPDPAVRRGTPAGRDRPGAGRRPAIVLADEPTGNLDSATGQSILALIEELHADGATIAVVTHDQAIAARMPRQLEMLDGQIISDTARPAAVGSPAGSHPAAGDSRDERAATR